MHLFKCQQNFFNIWRFRFKSLMLFWFLIKTWLKFLVISALITSQTLPLTTLADSNTSDIRKRKSGIHFFKTRDNLPKRDFQDEISLELAFHVEEAFEICIISTSNENYLFRYNKNKYHRYTTYACYFTSSTVSVN